MRRPLPATLLNSVQMIFVILFLGLMFYVTAIDLRRWQGDVQMEAENKRIEKLAIPLQLHLR